MKHAAKADWQNRVVTPDKVFENIEPGMSIFLGTGVGEPRTLVKHLMASKASNLRDLELIQLVSLGDAISLKALDTNTYRLKTFFSGWVASEAITAGRVDLIPSSFSKIPRLVKTGRIPIDVAFIQITPPNEAGYCSLGVAVDVTREAMETASLVVGEINPDIPMTFGDTFVPMSDFDYLVRSTEKPIYFNRWPVDEVFDRVAANVASVIEDGSCIMFSLGPLFEALSKHLVHKHNLGVHTPFITDALMDVIKSGAVTNRNKEIFRGKSLVSYAFGTPELMAWLNRNPLVEFQGIHKVFNPAQIGLNPKYVALLPVRKVDLSGRAALHFGKGNVTSGPGDIMDHFHGAGLSPGGLTIFALPSRNRNQEPNIRLSVEDFPNQFSIRESVDMIITEYGIATLSGRTIRERAQALIEIAHPDDRKQLLDSAKAEKILYPDQIFLAGSAHLYPAEIRSQYTFKGDITVRFRAIKPSDEEEMRRLFYRFSDEAVYYRYFSPIKTMPHAKMQEYVNVDFSQIMSIVGLVGEAGQGHIIAEARFVKLQDRPVADVAFIVDEQYQGLGLATHLYKMLIRLAKDRGLQGFTADVLASNKAMMKVFEKGGAIVKAELEYGVYRLTIPFEAQTSHLDED
ncbi:MAG: GNAT family N-acetyltransferase [Desulfobacterales bacterium]|nr:MAG: GNAT family N-acetyltransferase [Desulfobacterales bacterium]